jgi:hypothetical protein
MAWFDIFTGGGKTISEPVEAIGNVFDKLFTSDEEKEQAKAVMEKLRQRPAELQVELNKVEAQHRSTFVAGWRPAIGWVCALGLAFTFVVNPTIEWIALLTDQEIAKGPAVPTEIIMELVLAMLGMSALRTFEKKTGTSK